TPHDCRLFFTYQREKERSASITKAESISRRLLGKRGDLETFHHPVERTVIDMENLCRTREIPLGAAQDITHVTLSDLIESRVARKERLFVLHKVVRPF